MQVSLYILLLLSFCVEQLWFMQNFEKHKEHNGDVQNIIDY